MRRQAEKVRRDMRKPEQCAHARSFVAALAPEKKKVLKTKEHWTLRGPLDKERGLFAEYVVSSECDYLSWHFITSSGDDVLGEHLHV
jgi:hypothetical protein